MKKKTKKILAIGAGIATGGLLVCGIYKQWKKGVFNYNIMKDICSGREPSYREVQLLKTGAYLMADALVKAYDKAGYAVEMHISSKGSVDARVDR